MAKQLNYLGTLGMVVEARQALGDCRKSGLSGAAGRPETAPGFRWNAQQSQTCRVRVRDAFKFAWVVALGNGDRVRRRGFSACGGLAVR